MCTKTAVPGQSSGSSVSQTPAKCLISLFRKFRRLNFTKLVYLKKKKKKQVVIYIGVHKK